MRAPELCHLIHYRAYRNLKAFGRKNDIAGITSGLAFRVAMTTAKCSRPSADCEVANVIAIACYGYTALKIAASRALLYVVRRRQYGKFVRLAGQIISHRLTPQATRRARRTNRTARALPSVALEHAMLLIELTRLIGETLPSLFQAQQDR